MTDIEIIQGSILKVGDTGPPLRVRCINENGDPENLTGQTGTIKIRKSDGDSNKVDAAVSLHEPELGIVEYDWQSGDTDTEGIFVAEVTMDDGTDTISYPNDTYFKVHIMEAL